MLFPVEVGDLIVFVANSYPTQNRRAEKRSVIRPTVMVQSLLDPDTLLLPMETTSRKADEVAFLATGPDFTQFIAWLN